jgi:hypothetical protein
MHSRTLRACQRLQAQDGQDPRGRDPVRGAAGTAGQLLSGCAGEGLEECKSLDFGANRDVCAGRCQNSTRCWKPGAIARWERSCTCTWMPVMRKCGCPDPGYRHSDRLKGGSIHGHEYFVSKPIGQKSCRDYGIHSEDPSPRSSITNKKRRIISGAR